MVNVRGFFRLLPMMAPECFERPRQILTLLTPFKYCRRTKTAAMPLNYRSAEPSLTQAITFPAPGRKVISVNCQRPKMESLTPHTCNNFHCGVHS
jgi:hypothetical protein